MKRRTCRISREKAAGDLSSVSSSRLRFQRIKKRRQARGATQSEQHQAKMKRENKMRYRQQDSGQAAAAEIRQHRLGALREWERRIVQVSALGEPSDQKHQHH